MNNHLYQSANQKLHSGFAQCTGRERMARSPRVFASGDLKLLLLEFIGERPRHGYDLIQQIKGLFDGAYTPSPGVIYPALAFLEAGHLYLGQQVVALKGVHMRIDVSRRSLRGLDRPAEIHEAMHNLRHALQLHQGHWSPKEIQRVHDLLNNTAKAIVSG